MDKYKRERERELAVSCMRVWQCVCVCSVKKANARPGVVDRKANDENSRVGPVRQTRRSITVRCISLENTVVFHKVDRAPIFSLI